MKSKIFISVFILLNIGCSPLIKDTFNSIELTSTKGEKIYINSLNWGATDDYQMTIISSNKKRIMIRKDTLDVVKGLEPFIYCFENDSLKLFFKEEITYAVKDTFSTIKIAYKILDNTDFYRARNNSNRYHSVPALNDNIAPSEFPKAPK
jgi:hypothetical protein